MTIKKDKQWNKLFPSTINNDFNGYKFTLIFFYILTGVTIIRSLLHIVLPDGGAGTIASIDISVDGGQTIIGIFALWGLSQLFFGILYIIISIRYRNLVPLMYLFIFIEYSIRIIIGLTKTIETTRIAPGAIGNFVLVPLSIILFIFALKIPKRKIITNETI